MFAVEPIDNTQILYKIFREAGVEEEQIKGSFDLGELVPYNTIGSQDSVRECYPLY